MGKEKYIEDLNQIRDIMNRSSRFISLSGLSGISAGVFAIIGVTLAYWLVYDGQDYFTYRQTILRVDKLTMLLIAACGTIIGAVTSGIYFTVRATKQRQEKIWDSQVKKLLINLAIPLITGGVLVLLLVFKGFIGLAAPLTLIFYGLALVNASKYTVSEIRGFGIIQIVLGLFAVQFIGYGLFFWGIGFGLMHIIYGLYMLMKGS